MTNVNVSIATVLVKILKARAAEIERLRQRGEFSDDIAAARIDELTLIAESVDDLAGAAARRLRHELMQTVLGDQRAAGPGRSDPTRGGAT